ncbi:hypothetical protein EKG37_17630 [Robertmurraya yapensis]|uniref:Urease accessory protein UreH-like transmembrane domain-containing protein n=2 Tax=Bacillaceae TaxID=186817 RepID=A0A3S0I5S7_9BACI|nr:MULTISPECIES: hypothetical protein [Bacillaceae]RTR28122.1 hypothetical protein EKG37_17630 [Bacillus yapensis]TKC15156.1 hypothetical protein FA727_19935 [Robertmurraya kyonggiensis]TKS94365.1 hypothetical protein FAR12_17635 [Bacillus yapensis]
MTLEVSLLGEETFKKKIKVCCHYLLASIISGAISGFFYTLIIFVFFSWIPHLIKMAIFTLMLGLYTLDHFNIIKVKVPERKWQIPVEWVKGKTVHNMWIWGLILGAGIFTYLPYATFYILYIYIGLFLNPVIGLLFGIIYAFSRALPTILVALKNKELELIQIKKLYQNKTKKYKYFNGFSLLIFFVFMMYVFFKQYIINLI